MQNLTWILAAAMGLWALVAEIYSLGTKCSKLYIGISIESLKISNEIIS